MEIISKSAKTLGKDHSNSVQLVSLLMAQVQTLVSAERSQLFLVDEVARKMVLITERGESRMAMSAGLQGACLQSSSLLNVKEVAKDSRFDMESDKKAMLNTRCAMCVPLRENTGLIAGVIMVANKKSYLLWSGNSQDTFDSKDENAIEIFASLIGPRIADVFKSTIKRM